MFSIRSTFTPEDNHVRLEESLIRAETELALYLSISSIEEIEVEKLEVRRYLQRTLSGEEASNLEHRLIRLLWDNPTNEQLKGLYDKLDALRASIKS